MDSEDKKIVVAVITPGEGAEGDMGLNYPKALLPLAHTPLLYITMPHLIKAGITKILYFCKPQHMTALQEKWSSIQIKNHWLHITLSLLPCETGSMGECLRSLYSSQLLEEDFLHLRSDTLISNLDIEEALDNFRRRTETDPQTVMLMLLNPQVKDPRIISKSDPIPLKPRSKNSWRCAEPKVPCHRASTIMKPDGRLISFKRRQRGEKERVPRSILYENPRLIISPQLGDPHISVCAASLISLFQDHFDCNLIEDIVTELSHQESLNNASIYMHLTEGATCVHTWSDYSRVTNNLIRSQYFDPKNSRLTGRKKYSKRNSYIAKGAVVSGDVSCSMLGEAVTVEVGTVVKQSVVGAWSRVGEASVLVRVVTEDGCQLEGKQRLHNCYLAERVTVNRGISLECCVVDAGLVVSSSVPRGSHIYGSEGGKVLYRKISGGGEWDKDGVPFLWEPFIARALRKKEEIEEEGEDLTDGYCDNHTKNKNIFRMEVEESLVSGIQDNYTCSKVMVEVNASRFAYNMNLEETQQIVLESVLRSMKLANEAESDEQDEADFSSWALMQQGLRKWMVIIQGLHSASPIAILATLNEICGAHPQLLRAAPRLLHFFSQETEMLPSDDAVLKYFQSEPKNDREKFESFKNAVKPFLKWLEEAESEESDEAESEESEEESE